MDVGVRATQDAKAERVGVRGLHPSIDVSANGWQYQQNRHGFENNKGREAMITRYSFGKMEIDRITYCRDLIILPDGSVSSPWWRIDGHVLTVADIQDILVSKPAYLVVGTGSPGMMQPDTDFLARVEAKGIKVAILPTTQAVREYNMLSERGGECAGCFHLTC